MSDDSSPNLTNDLILNQINQLVDVGYRVEFRQAQERAEVHVYFFGDANVPNSAHTQTADQKYFEADFVTSALADVIANTDSNMEPIHTYRQTHTTRPLELILQLNQYLDLGYRLEFQKIEGTPQIIIYVFDFAEPQKPDRILTTAKAHSQYFVNTFVDMTLASTLQKAKQLLPPEGHRLSKHPHLLKFEIYEIEAAQEPTLNTDDTYDFPVHMSTGLRSILQEHLERMQNRVPARILLAGKSQIGHIVEVRNWENGIGWVAVFRPT